MTILTVLFQILISAHVATGFAGLAAFWVPGVRPQRRPRARTRRAGLYVLCLCGDVVGHHGVGGPGRVLRGSGG